VGNPQPLPRLTAPRGSIHTASELAERSGVSGPAAWRLYRALQDGGHLGARGQVTLVRELLSRWRAAVQRPQQRLGARWVLPGRNPLRRLHAALAGAWRTESTPSACLGLEPILKNRGAPISTPVIAADPASLWQSLP